MKPSIQFIVQKEIESIGLRGAYFKVENLTNAEYHPEFEEYIKLVVKNAIYEMDKDSGYVRNDSLLQGFRKLHENTGISNYNDLSIPENLYHSIAKHHAIPRINLLTDIYNAVSVKYKLVLGAHDLSMTEGNIHLRFTRGDEKYLPIGSLEQKNVPANHYSYIDDSNEIICYLDVQQVNKTVVSPDTTDCFFIVQGNSVTTNCYIQNAVYELIDLVKRYCGGQETLLGIVGQS